MARRLFMHVGCPKTGTSFLQGVLWNNRETLAGEGLVLPAARRHHYRASLYARDIWRERPAAHRIEADWHQLVDAVHAADGDVLITHELFAAATAAQARSVLDALGPAEVHIVLTVRDLARQIPAQWQQDVKEGSTDRLGDYAQDVMKRGPRAQWFWTVQDVPVIARHWAEGLRPEHVHLVTVPPEGSDPRVLWSRFASVFGVEADAVDLTGGRRNESLGAVEIELLRWVNQYRDERFPVLGSHRWFKDRLANEILARRPEKQKFVIDPSAHDWVLATSRETVADLERGGYDVVGDLNDLIPPGRPESGEDPSQVADQELLRAATETIVDILDVHRSTVLDHERLMRLEHVRQRQPSGQEAGGSRATRLIRAILTQVKRVGRRLRSSIRR